MYEDQAYLPIPADTPASELCPDCSHLREGVEPWELANKVRQRLRVKTLGPRCNTVMELGDPAGDAPSCQCRHLCHAETISHRTRLDEG